MPTEDAKRERASELLERARTLGDDEALALYQEVLHLVPDYAAAYYNVGLIYKYQGKWKESFDFNKSAVRLRPGDEASNWNLAIAATALRDWPTARSVWQRLGLLKNDGEGPILGNFGNALVRLNPNDGAEVVWAHRICPVRARIINIPLPETNFRHGDVVLHDGAAVGSRLSEAKEYSVFNVLELFEASDFSTYIAEIHIARESDADELTALFDEAQISNEDWTVNVRSLCKQCSEGRPHEQHDHELQREHRDRHRIGIATKIPDSAREIMQRWSNRTRWFVRFESKLSPPVKH